MSDQHVGRASGEMTAATGVIVELSSTADGYRAARAFYADWRCRMTATPRVGGPAPLAARSKPFGARGRFGAVGRW